ncbi:AAA family ATPase, partial [Cronobacter malonaticus]
KKNDDAPGGAVDLKEKDASTYLNLLFNFFFLNEVLDSAANNAFIITSERTGISLFQKEIDGNRSNIVDSYMLSKMSTRKLLSFDEIMSQKVAKFSEPINHNINVIRDFSDLKKMKSILTHNGLRKAGKERNDLIKTLESLTGGRYSTSDGEAIFTVSCTDGDKVSMPLSLSSASNKALFLLDIYVRYYMSSDSYLIIDEPELNLHPHNQIKMAELLVRLSNCGVKIIITTHSDYIVKEINNRIMASKLDDRVKLSDFGYKDIDLISSEKVNGFTIGSDGFINEAGGNAYGVNAFLFDNVISDIERKADLLYTYLEEGF